MTLGARRILVLALSSLGVFPVAAAGQWPPIDPGELTLRTPRIDPGADAEMLLWEVRINDDTTLDDPTTVLEHHLRIKIFNDRGRDATSTVDLTYTNGRRIRDIKGRTVAPDGTVTELNGDDVRDRTILEASGLKIRAKSFVLPAVVPGAIIEYRWREIRDDSIAHYLELPFQREVPVHLVRYYIKPLAVRDIGYQMRSQIYNLNTQPETLKGDNGYTIIQMRDMPAVGTEALMPAELSGRAWMLIYYADLAWANLTEPRFWDKWAGEAYDAFEGELRTSSEIKQAAVEATRGATSIEQKIDALVKFVRGRVKRTDVDTSAPSTGEGKPSTGARDTLERGAGTGDDVTVLFAALATAAGLEARLAVMPDRDNFVAPRTMKQPYFLSQLAAAVKNGDEWRFVDVANEHARSGHLRWQQEGTYALMLDDKTAAFVDVPVMPAEQSKTRRTGTLKILPTGAVEGDIAVEYTGHFATRFRERDDDETPAERERLFEEAVWSRLPEATVSNFRTEHLESSDNPYIIRFTVSMPGYAQRTGSRMLVQPAVLQRGFDPVFTTASRSHPIHFPFAWSEEDAFTFELPDGYEIESATSPTPVSLADANGRHAAAIAAPDGRRVTYTRSFSLGRGGGIFYPTEAYGGLKRFFDAVHTADAHVLSLRRAGSGDGK